MVRASLVGLLTWLGEGKRLIGGVTGVALVGSLAVALLLLAPVYTARTTLLPPGSQQQSGSAAALAALGALGGLAGGLGAKTPDELYVALLKSDSVYRELDQQFKLRERYELKSFEALRKALPKFVPVWSDKKAGVIAVEVDDEDPKFAAELANAHVPEVTRLLSRLAVSEAQLRRVFFEAQLQTTKENLIKAERDLQRVQEKSGVIVLDKQAEALIGGAAQIRAQIAEREVQLRVLRGSATDQNPDAPAPSSEARALRGELARMESTPGRHCRQHRGHPGRQDSRGGDRLRARPPRAEDAGDHPGKHAAPVRDRQARRGQGRPGAAAGRRGAAARLQVEAVAGATSCLPRPSWRCCSAACGC